MDAIEDRTRNLQRKSSWEDPPDRREMLGSTHAFDLRGRPLGVFETKAAAVEAIRLNTSPGLTDKDAGHVVRDHRPRSSAASWVALAARSTLTALVAAARSEPLQHRRRPRVTKLAGEDAMRAR